MNKLSIITSVFIFTVIIIGVIDTADAYKTSGYNFCSAFPAYPECTGWRTDPLSDSFNLWFCDYVDLEGICENKPKPELKIDTRDQNYCCRFIGQD